MKLKKVLSQSMSILSAITILWFILPDTILSQTSQRNDAGVANYYKQMIKFTTHLPQQTQWFLRLPGASPDYSLGPRDEISIVVVGSEMLTQSFKISNSGKINFLLLGNIQAEGLTAGELEAVISKLLKEKGLINNPEVLVYITSYQAKPIYVAGEVDNPGEYVMSQQLTLMDAILLAGGLDYTAARYGYLHRRVNGDESLIGSNLGEKIQEMPVFNALMDQTTTQSKIMEHPDVPTPGTEVIKIDLEPMKSGGVLNPNVVMKAHDVFVVPRRNVESFYVIGDVALPGAYEVQWRETLLASHAISYAGGPTRTSRMSKGILLRYQNGERKEKKVDFAAILRGDQDDFEVLPDDIIFIPGSHAKTLGYSILGLIPGSVERSINER